MKRILLATIFLALLFNNCFTQEENYYYLGQEVPGEQPRVFYLPINEWAVAERIAFSSNQDEIYFTEFSGPEKNYARRIKYLEYDGHNWIGPFLFCENCECPLFSPDDKSLFLNSVYYLRQDTAWSGPVKFFPNKKVVHYLQKCNTGNYFYLTFVNDSTTDIFQVELQDQDTLETALGFNMKSRVQNDYFMDPDEEFVLVSLNREEIECYGGKDIFIRFRTGSGWTKPLNLGEEINSRHSQSRYGMSLSPDKKYMFYTQIDHGKATVFWVRVDRLFEKLKAKSAPFQE